MPTTLHADASAAYFLTALSQGQNHKIIVYGTSLTANAMWPMELQNTLNTTYGKHLRVVNSASGGKDSRWGLENLTKLVINKNPDTVFIEFSINDALANSRISVDQSMANLRLMISTIRRERKYCDIIIMIMNPPTGEALEKRPHIISYQNGYSKVAKETSTRLINFSPMWEKMIINTPKLWQHYAPDGLHPNDKANSEIILPFLLQKIGFQQPTAIITNSK